MISRSSTSKNCFCILYDYFNTYGGAEYLSLVMCKGLPGSHLYVSDLSDDYRQDMSNVVHRPCVILNKSKAVPLKIHAILCFLFFVKVNSYETTIYSGYYSIFASFFHYRGRKIYYCHSVPKAIFDADYQRGFLSSKGKFRFVFYGALRLYRILFLMSLNKMDMVLSNSSFTKCLLEKHCNINSKVIYPPVDIKYFVPASQDFWDLKNKNRFISIGRLEPLKNISAVIEAFLECPSCHLTVISGGSLMPKFLELVENVENIELTGWISKQMLKAHMQSVMASIYIPTKEDFGISVVESLACGIPVITVAQGGCDEIINSESIGVKLDPEEDLSVQIRDVCCRITNGELRFSREECLKRASMFSDTKFLRDIKNALD